MTQPNARTPDAAARLEGTGLFSAKPTAIEFRPAAPGSGYTLRIDDAHPFPIRPRHLSTALPHPALAQLGGRMTALEATPQGPHAFTVEHALSALVGLAITDAEIALTGPEVPIFDGSASPFADAITAVGIRTHETPAAPITLREPILVEQGPASVRIEPADTPTYTYTLDYTGSPLGVIPPATATWTGDPTDYTDTIAPARTFCLAAEAQAMTAMGLFEHLSPRDMLVFGPDGPIDNELRLPDEPARHKLLDLIGDLAVLGRPLCARVTATRSGHALNHAAAKAVADQLTDQLDV